MTHSLILLSVFVRFLEKKKEKPKNKNNSRRMNTVTFVSVTSFTAHENLKKKRNLCNVFLHHSERLLNS